MDTPEECRREEFEEKYRGLYGCYSDEVSKDEFDDEAEYKEFMRDSIRNTRKKLGWR